MTERLQKPGFTTRRGLMAGVASFVAVTMLATGALAQREDGPQPRPPLPQLVGFDVPVPHLEDMEAARTQLTRIVELGANAVRFVVPLYQPHGGSPAPKLDQRPARGPTDADLLALIQHARKLGLQTALVPRLAFTRPQGDEDIGELNPPDWEVWWVAYAQGVTHYARLAERTGVDLFGIADGLDSALDPLRHAGALNRWDALLADTRDAYTGPIAAWTTAPRAAVTADALGLDVIAVRPVLHFEQRDIADADRRDKAMGRQWEHLAGTLGEAARAQGRPIVVAGVGLPARADAWSGLPYTPFAPDFADEQIQATSAVQSSFVRSFLSAWTGLVPAPPGSGDARVVAGVFFADWRLDRAGGPFDPSHAMQGKPAEAILRRYFSGDHE